MLHNLPGVTSVHSRFYDLSSKYYQTIGNHASYYKDALRFLGCVDIRDLPGTGLRPRHTRSSLSEHCCEVLEAAGLSSPSMFHLLEESAWLEGGQVK